MGLKFTCQDSAGLAFLLCLGAWVTSFLVGLAMAVLSPVVQAVTANTVPPEDLASAISLQAMASNASRVLGPALCAPLVSSNLYEISWSLYSIGLALAVTPGHDLLGLRDQGQ